MQLYEGIIKSWRGDKGFGFIQPNEGEKDIFIHIRDLKHDNYKPIIGDKVVYKIITDKNGKIRAYDAFIKGQKICNTVREETFKKQSFHHSKEKSKFGLVPRIIIALIPFILSAWLLITKSISLPLFAYLIFSPVTFLCYAYDKSMALKDQWRVAESTLHLFELLGGWPAALIAQYTIRHKNKKQSFQITFWLIVFIHIAVWTDVLWFNKLSIATVL
jgi:uncharacterized membrane protein YsdA (DUF1294 family)/cold shock CspA family protein